ncbi:hypothetical protein SAMN05877753_103341 [Bacillus oleivorans]|uniref:GK1464-like domain-containing protein n=1 Tax=Bacillus oleivorans TaxID=1448271 RepID=A0A285CQW5_9BACI|nr:DUF5634 family protein [Bacillus oleivorans]SNX69959.1 hypothetical protein SAMN05877753_103341 [Bacillus oleivorans]
MDFLPREQIIRDLQQSFQMYINQYGIEDIGIFEEEGEDDRFYLGYTVRKDGKTYHIHTPYMKNNNGELAVIHEDWTVETDEPQREDLSGYPDLDSVFREI